MFLKIYHHYYKKNLINLFQINLVMLLHMLMDITLQVYYLKIHYLNIQII